jgi:hypothetical protein
MSRLRVDHREPSGGGGRCSAGWASVGGPSASWSSSLCGQGDHEEGLRRTRGDAAGVKLDPDPAGWVVIAYTNGEHTTMPPGAVLRVAAAVTAMGGRR